MTLSKLASRIKDGTKAIEEGELSYAEMEQLLTDVSHLHERMVILKYKAMEKLARASKEETVTKTFPETQTAERNVSPSAEETTVKKTKEKQITILDALEEIKAEESLNEKLANVVPKETVASKLKNQPITDLLKSISLNQKFIFIKGLFDENSNAFESELKKLNAFPNGGEALTYLKEDLRENYKWHEKDELFIQLTELVQRRYV